jgi:hypothetical protein
LVHAAGDEEDADAGLAGGGDRGLRARVQESVLADERAIEVAGEDLDVAREVGRQFYCVDSTT